MASAGRGGPRHKPKPYVDSGLLFSSLEKHSELLKDLGPYEHVSRTMGADAKGLILTMPLWKALIAVEPTGEIHCQPLRTALLSLLADNAELNHTRSSGQVWANLKVERITVLLTHVRKVARDQNLGPLAAKLTKDEFMSLTAALKLLELPDPQGLEKPRAPLEKGSSRSLVSIEPSVPLEKGDEKLGKAKKKLKAQSSDVSMDAHGFPAIFASSPEKEKKSPPTKEGPPLLVSKQRPGQRLAAARSSMSPAPLQEALGYGGKALKRPAAAKGLEKPLKRPAAAMETTEGLEKPNGKDKKKSLAARRLGKALPPNLWKMAGSHG